MIIQMSILSPRSSRRSPRSTSSEVVSSVINTLELNLDRRHGFIGQFDTRSKLYAITGFQVLPYIGTRHRVIVSKLQALSCYIGWDRVIVPTIVHHSDPQNVFNSTTEKIDDVDMKMVMFINTIDKMGVELIDLRMSLRDINLASPPNNFNLFNNVVEFQDIDLWNQVCCQLFSAIPIAVRIDTKAHLFHIGYQRQDLNHQLLYIGYHEFQAGTKQSPANSNPMPSQLEVVEPGSVDEYMKIIEKLVKFISLYGVANREGITDPIVKTVTSNIHFIVRELIENCNFNRLSSAL